MLSRLIFCIAVAAATLAVVLLALVSPVPHRTSPESVDLSLYLRLYQSPASHRGVPTPPPRGGDNGALVFRHLLTEGPENTSRIIGHAQGFVIPAREFERAAFNIVYLDFDSSAYAGSLSVEVKELTGGGEEIAVVGGTGVFAFARGYAEFDRNHAHADGRRDRQAAAGSLKLRLIFPDRSSSMKSNNSHQRENQV